MAIITKQVIASPDDCVRVVIQISPFFAFSLTNPEVKCLDFNNPQQDFQSGMRFTSLNIAQGTKIVQAFLEISATNTVATPSETKIEGEDVDSAATFSTEADYSGRSRTSASVLWTPASWVSGSLIRSINIRTVIQEIIDRPGWSALNDLVLFWSDPLPGFGGTNLLNGHSFDGSAALAPKLIISDAGGQMWVVQM